MLKDYFEEEKYNELKESCDLIYKALEISKATLDIKLSYMWKENWIEIHRMNPC